MIKIGSEIQAIKPLRSDLKDTLQRLGEHFFAKKRTTVNPVLSASNCWNIVSDQLKDILGNEIHRQWFSHIHAIVISDKLLILQTPNRASALWINKYYQNLVDLLLSFQDKDLSSFFISPCDVTVGNEDHENTDR